MRLLTLALLLMHLAPAEAAPLIAGCPLFPGNHVLNTRVDNLPVHANSAAYIAAIGASRSLKADFGAGLWEGGPIGIPFDIVVAGQPGTNVSFDYADESDPPPYPVPRNASIEGGSQSSGDRHVLLVDRDACKLYELYAMYPNADGSWRAGSGAIFDLNANRLRPATWTSADAAGLSILQGLARYDEAASGAIQHALRVTSPVADRHYTWPARHAVGSNNAAYPPMGTRLRLKAGVDISGAPAIVRVLLQAMKTYGLVLADLGSAWYVSGAPDERWNNDDLRWFGRLKGSDFEVVDVSALRIDPDSAAAASTGRFSARVSVIGPRSNRSLTATLEVATADVGRSGAIFLVAQAGSRWFAHDGTGWQDWNGGPLPAHAAGVLAGRTVSIASGMDMRALGAVKVWLGYGTDAGEMLANGRYELVYSSD